MIGFLSFFVMYILFLMVFNRIFWPVLGCSEFKCHDDLIHSQGLNTIWTITSRFVSFFPLVPILHNSQNYPSHHWVRVCQQCENSFKFSQVSTPSGYFHISEFVYNSTHSFHSKLMVSPCICLFLLTLVLTVLFLLPFCPHIPQGSPVSFHSNVFLSIRSTHTTLLNVPPASIPSTFYSVYRIYHHLKYWLFYGFMMSIACLSPLTVYMKRRGMIALIMSVAVFPVYRTVLTHNGMGAQGQLYYLIPGIKLRTSSLPDRCCAPTPRIATEGIGNVHGIPGFKFIGRKRIP